jgi:hypothetical protein
MQTADGGGESPPDKKDVFVHSPTPALLVMSCSASATVSAYSLSGLYAQVDMVKLSPVYDEILSQKIAQSPLQIPFTNYNVVPGTQTTGLTGTVRFSSTADSLQKLYATFIPSTYQSLNSIKDTVTYLSPNFNRGSANLGNAGLTCRFTINGNGFPDMPLQNDRGEILQQTLQVIAEDHDITSSPHPNLNTVANWNSKFWVFANSFTFDDEDSKSRKCGLSALGNALQGSWDYTAATVVADVVQPIIIMETKSVLEIAPNRAVRVIY